MTSRSGRVRISRDKLVGVVVALACLAFSAVGMKVYDSPDFIYVDGIRNEPISIEQSELTVSDVTVGTRLVDDGEVKAETTGMFVAITATLAVPGSQKVILNQSQLITQTRTYDSWSSALLSAEPGFADTEQLYFEIDPAQIDDLTLESGRPTSCTGSMRAAGSISASPRRRRAVAAGSGRS